MTSVVKNTFSLTAQYKQNRYNKLIVIGMSFTHIIDQNVVYFHTAIRLYSLMS